MKHAANTTWGCFTYLLAKGYNAATGSIIAVAINPGWVNCVNINNPGSKLYTNSLAAYCLVTYPDANGLFLHLYTFLSYYLSR